MIIIPKNKKKAPITNKEIKEIEIKSKNDGYKYISYLEYPPRCSEVFQIIISVPESLLHYNDITTGIIDDIHFSIMDFSYTMGKNNHYHHTLCLLSKDEEISFPQIYIKSKKANGHVYEFGKNLMIDSDFSSCYTLQVKKDKNNKTKNLFSPSVIKEFKDVKNNNYEFETKEEYLLVKAQDPKNYEERKKMLSDSVKIYKALLESYMNIQ